MLTGLRPGQKQCLWFNRRYLWCSRFFQVLGQQNNSDTIDTAFDLFRITGQRDIAHSSTALGSKASTFDRQIPDQRCH